MKAPVIPIPHDIESKGHMALVPALAVAAIAALYGVVVLHAPPAHGEMGVVFAPWTSQSEAAGAIVAAGGRLVDSARLPNVMIAYGADADFAERVRAQGAWFTVAARGLCASA